MIGLFQIDYLNKNNDKFIYHFYGHYGSGKTAIARYLCRFAIENGIVPIFIDTHGALLHDQIIEEGIDDSAIIYIPPMDAVGSKLSKAIYKNLDSDSIVIIDNIATLGQRSKTLIEALRTLIFDPTTYKLKANVVIMNNMRATMVKENSSQEMYHYVPYGWDFLHSFSDVTFRMIRNRTSDDRLNVTDRISCKVVSSKINFLKENDILSFYLKNGKYDEFKTCIIGAIEQGIAWKVGDSYIIDDVVSTSPASIYETVKKLIYNK